jgi:hypothetical protein
MPLSSLFVVTRTLLTMRAPVETVSRTAAAKGFAATDASTANATRALRLVLKEQR